MARLPPFCGRFLRAGSEEFKETTKEKETWKLDPLLVKKTLLVFSGSGKPNLPGIWILLEMWMRSSHLHNIKSVGNHRLTAFLPPYSGLPTKKVCTECSLNWQERVCTQPCSPLEHRQLCPHTRLRQKWVKLLSWTEGIEKN